jgi:hypothetical protein
MLSAKTQYIRTGFFVIRFLPPLVAGQADDSGGRRRAALSRTAPGGSSGPGWDENRSGASTLRSNRQRPAMPPRPDPYWHVHSRRLPSLPYFYRVKVCCHARRRIHRRPPSGRSCHQARDERSAMGTCDGQRFGHTEAAARPHHVTSCRMRASRRGLDSTYTAVVRMLLWPAISAIAFRSIPRSASRVISVRLPLCDEAPDTPASR